MLEQNKDNNKITPFAVTNWRDIRQKFGIKEKNRRGHMYIIGKTGTGKSTLIENMVISDIQAGNGLALIDPHGDLAENVLDYIPENRIDDVIYYNPADIEYPIAFNPLKKVHPDFYHLASSGLISIFKKLWPDFWGPRLEHILRHSILTILECPKSTLLDIPRLLTDKEFRKRVLENVKNQQVKEFWLFEFDKYSAWLKSEATAPILNKIGQFLVNIPLRNIVGQTENTFSLRKVMDEGKILVVNLTKGKIGEDNCALLGSMMVSMIWLAALGRSYMPEKERRPFYLYVDEVHNFLTLSLSDTLSEARKYGLNLVLAHQYIEQLDERIRAAIFGNVGTMISFRVGSEDAKILAGEFRPKINEADLVSLPNYHIYLKLMIDGVTSKPFSAITLPSPEKKESHKTRAVETSRLKYGRLREEVEKDVVFISQSESNIKSKTGQMNLFR